MPVFLEGTPDPDLPCTLTTPVDTIWEGNDGKYYVVKEFWFDGSRYWKQISNRKAEKLKRRAEARSDTNNPYAPKPGAGY